MEDVKANVYLTGFMGTGKSSVGRVLAKKMRRPFVDIDRVIEKQERRKISDIFKKEGEKIFRGLEEKTIAKQSRRKGFVIALGGGALLRSSTRRRIEKTGVVVKLTCSQQKLAHRLQGQRSKRPLLQGSNFKKRLAALMDQRRNLRTREMITVSTTNRSISQVAALIAQKIYGQ